MESFKISILGAEVTYVSSVPLCNYFEKNKDKMEFYNATVEEVKDISTSNGYTIYYFDTEDKSDPINVSGKNMIVKYPFSELTESIILYLGSHFFERQFGEMGICSCHSSCVSKNGEATLIIGEAGAGKTSLAVNLCRRGYELISNDMTLIGLSEKGITAFGGTKFINLRRASVNKNMPDLLPLFKDNSKDSWRNKISVMARDIGIEEEYEATPITNIILLRLDDNEKLHVTSGDTWNENFHFYQNTSSHIRGSAACFIDKHGHPIGYIPSMDTKETFDKRMNLQNEINQSDNYKYVVGPLSDVIEYVDSIYLSQERGSKKYEKK